MGQTRAQLGQMMDRLGNVVQTAGSRHMLYLILFTVAVLFFLFYFMRGS